MTPLFIIVGLCLGAVIGYMATHRIYYGCHWKGHAWERSEIEGAPYREAATERIEPKRPWWVPLVTLVLSRLRIALSTEWRLQRRLMGGHWERVLAGDWDTTVADRWVRVDHCRCSKLPIQPILAYWLECEDWP